MTLTCPAQTFYNDDYGPGSVSSSPLGPPTNWTEPGEPRLGQLGHGQARAIRASHGRCGFARSSCRRRAPRPARDGILVREPLEDSPLARCRAVRVRAVPASPVSPLLTPGGAAPAHAVLEPSLRDRSRGILPRHGCHGSGHHPVTPQPAGSSCFRGDSRRTLSREATLTVRTLAAATDAMASDLCLLPAIPVSAELWMIRNHPACFRSTHDLILTRCLCAWRLVSDCHSGSGTATGTPSEHVQRKRGVPSRCRQAERRCHM